VVGLYKDGRLNQDAWEQLGARFSAPFGSTCEAFYGAKLNMKAPALGSAVDDFARQNGVSDGLLDELAPMATGDALLLVTMAGPTPHATTSSTASAPMSAPPPARGGGRMGRAGSTLGGPRRMEPDAFELSALLFSKSEHRSITRVALRYTGASFDEAVAKLTERMGTELHGMTCGAWSFDAPVDPARVVEKMNSEE
jgi:hypothetical protein